MRRGFTLLELVFVIVIMGVLSKFGVELLYKTYENYVYSNVFNRLQDQSEMAVKQIANRLQYRIKDSTIQRDSLGDTAVPIGNAATGAVVLEWMGVEIDDLRSTGTPRWTGLIDLDTGVSSAASLRTPGGTYTTSTSGAIFFIGSDVDLGSEFGWGGAILDQNASMHPVNILGNTISPSVGNFGQSDGGVFEFYQFSRSAYAVSLEGNDLVFYYDYQPWSGTAPNSLANASKDLIMENVSSFEFTSLGDILIIQVCVSDMNATGIGEYAICKEKVVF